MENQRHDTILKILLLGDSHGDLRHIRWAYEKAQEWSCEIVFSLGDTGMWVHTPDGLAFLQAVDRIAEETGIEFYWIDGNHDPLIHVLNMFDVTDEQGFIWMGDHVRYAPRGHHWKWNNTTFCSLGGAWSIDWRWRKDRYKEIREVFKADLKMYADDELDRACRPYELWWEGELLTDEDVEKAIAGGKIDVLLSHDTGTDVDITGHFLKKGHTFFNETATTMNQARVQRVIDACRPSRCFNGHYHLPWRERVHGTDYVALDCNLNKASSWHVLEV